MKAVLLGKPYNLESKMDTCVKEIIWLKNENQEHNKTQTRLLTEILNIKRLLTEKTATSNRETAFPKTPFETKEEFLHFEDEIQRDAEKVKIIENEIFLIGIPECGKFVRAVWKRLVIDEVACQITWKNVDNKISLQNLAITAAFKENFLTRRILRNLQQNGFKLHGTVLTIKQNKSNYKFMNSNVLVYCALVYVHIVLYNTQQAHM
ncbi:PREDICTED: uncharacterized protein LOC108364655 isoform X1 [Rhagoletis zephyria]|uniref:uncharacterized protein LOC108364655 isoform X1 n=1 Tax=Rhagoletis zephyria TaxID=28612 RepID=UPI0008116312|nr:PREDICTED: uncharacterized protein LOC108364655 isoform X1 [Rhagoletis zephyria]